MNNQFECECPICIKPKLSPLPPSVEDYEMLKSEFELSLNFLLASYENSPQSRHNIAQFLIAHGVMDAPEGTS